MPLQIDASDDNANWTKQSWDLPIHDIATLRAYIAAQGISVQQFKRQAIYRFNVAKLPWLRGL